MNAATGRLVLLGAITALGSLAIQIIVPALPMLADGIAVSPTDGQLVITVYLIVLAMAQLVWAPVADHHGRRPVLIAGIAIFIGGTLICALAEGLTVMLVGRVVQAVGAASSLVTGRAMATDGSAAGRAAAPLAILTSVTLISPAIAPAIGGAVTTVAGWRALFWIMAALSVVAMVLAIRLLPETRAGDRAPMHPGRLLRVYADVARQRGYIALALSNASITGGFYLFLAVSPFLLAAEGATAAFAGLFYSGVATAIIGGTLIVPLVLRYRPSWLSPLGSTMLSAGAIGVISVALIGDTLLGLFVSMSLIAFGAGLTGPALLAEAIERQRARASAAASLFGTLQMGGAAVISTVAVRLVPSRTAEMAMIGLLVLAAVAARHLWGGAPEPDQPQT